MWALVYRIDFHNNVCIALSEYSQYKKQRIENSGRNKGIIECKNIVILEARISIGFKIIEECSLHRDGKIQSLT
jgi:hypothetical protein